jgi:hypothetical protein
LSTKKDDTKSLQATLKKRLSPKQFSTSYIKYCDYEKKGTLQVAIVSKMRLSLFILASLLAAVSNAQWQYNPYRFWDSYPDERYNNNYFAPGAYNYPMQQNFGRSPAIAPAPVVKQQVEARFGTITLTLTTITTTTTATISSTCTISTAVSVCTASGGRRRRGMAPAKMLFDENDEESIFLPISPRYSYF